MKTDIQILMQAPLKVNQAKIIYNTVSVITLFLIAYLNYLSFDYIISIMTGALATVLAANALYQATITKKPKTFYLKWLYMLLLAAFIFIACDYGHGNNIYWIYFYPIAAFFLFPMRHALFLLMCYLPLAFYMLLNFSNPLHQPQILFSFAVITTVAIFLAIVKARTNQLLEPLISKDLDTGAQKEKFLRPTLSTEITRAEREGTGLLLMYIQLQPSTTNYRRVPLSFLQNISNCINADLRSFDRYYRLHLDDFAIILPHTATHEALNKAKAMLENIPDSKHKKNIQVGLSSLNVGDTANTLIDIARQECAYVFH